MGRKTKNGKKMKKKKKTWHLKMAGSRCGKSEVTEEAKQTQALLRPET